MHTKIGTVIGVNIGVHSIKVAELIKKGSDFAISNSALVDIKQGEGKEGKQAQVDALNMALNKIEAKNARIVCVIDSPKTIAIDLTIPKMPQNEMREAIHWKLKDKIPFSIEEANLDFKVMGSVKDAEGNKVRIRVAVTPAEIVNDMLNLFESIGLKIDSIIPASIAVHNLIHNKNMQNRGVAVLEMGELMTELLIYRDESLQFSRKLPVSGKEVTQSLRSTLVSQNGKVQLSAEEAEKIKKEYGIPDNGSNEMLLGKITRNQVLSLIRPKIEQLANEIERSFDFYREEFGEDVENVLMFGGGAKLKGLQQFLASELEKPVELGNVLNYIETSTNGDAYKLTEAHRFDIAIGAALHKPKGVNLIPTEIKDKKTRAIKMIALKSALIATCAIFGAILLNVYLGINKNQREITSIQNKIEGFMPELYVLNQKVELNHRLTSNPLWEEALKEISNVITVNVQLDEIEMSNNTISLKGIINDKIQQNEIILSEFMQKLEGGIFKNVRLIKSVNIKDEQEKIEFELNAGIE